MGVEIVERGHGGGGFCSMWALSSFLYGRPRVNWIRCWWQ
jgi:hypothetical protein